MAKIKSQRVPYIEIKECEYHKLLEDHMTLQALRIAGVEKLPMYKSIRNILDDGRVEIHIKPIKKYYR